MSDKPVLLEVDPTDRGEAHRLVIVAIEEVNDGDNVTATTSLTDDLDMDSLGAVETMMKVEEDLGIVIGERLLDTIELATATVQDVLDLVDRVLDACVADGKDRGDDVTNVVVEVST